MSFSLSYSPKEEITNTVTHAVGALFSVLGLIMLLANAANGNDYSIRITSFSVYGCSLVLLFSASTLYHHAKQAQTKKLFKLFDHCAIYLLIAGTYTPLLLLSLEGSIRYVMLAIIWSIAFVGILFKIKYGHQYKSLSLFSYIGMGLISLPLIQQLSESLPDGGINLLAIGGAIYILGVVFYVNKRIPFNHAIWHVFVLGGAACHFFMMWFYV